MTTEIPVILTDGGITEGYAYISYENRGFFPEDSLFARDKKDYPEKYSAANINVAPSATSPGVVPVTITFSEINKTISTPVSVSKTGKMRPEARPQFKDYLKRLGAKRGDYVIYKRTSERTYQIYLKKM